MARTGGTDPALTELWRYPVKSLAGIRSEAVCVRRDGVAGDRRWAVVDAFTGAVVSAKHDPRLMYAWTEAGPGLAAARVAVPGLARAVPVDVAGETLSAWLDRAVAMVPWGRTAPGTAFDFGFPLEAEAHSFSDCGDVLHLLTTGTLAWFRTLGASDMDHSEAVRRTRPSLVVDAGPEPFAEDGWIGQSLLVGEVEVEVVAPTSRCVMIERAQPGFAALPGLLDALSEQRDGRLGVYAAVRRPGRLEVGLPVRLLAGAATDVG